MPKLTIDGKEIEVEAGTNLIEAARRLGIEVPDRKSTRLNSSHRQ